MRVDLDAEEERLESLPRFQSASAQARQLYQLSVVLAVIVILAWALAFSIGLFSSESLWPALLNNNAAALLVLAAGAQSAYWVARWRRDALNPVPEVPQVEPDEQPGGIDRLNQEAAEPGVGEDLLGDDGAREDPAQCHRQSRELRD